VSIVLHIERLVIDEVLMQGKRPASVRVAIENGLTWHLAQPGAINALRGIGVAAALPATELPAFTRPHDDLGERVAAAVQQQLGIPPRAATTPSRGRTAGEIQRG
jgi:hypothetical protein